MIPAVYSAESRAAKQEFSWLNEKIVAGLWGCDFAIKNVMFLPFYLFSF